MAKEQKVKPAFKCRSKNVSATVWKKEVKKDKLSFTVYNTEIVKNYKTEDGEYEKTSNFSQEELGDVIVVSQMAQQYIVNDRQRSYEDEEEED